MSKHTSPSKVSKVTQNLDLDSKAIGVLPIINQFIERLGIAELLDRHVPSKENMTLSHGQMLLLLIRNILVERQPLYNLPDWAMTYDGLFTGLVGISRKALNDDRIGRALNELFLAERPTMLTDLTLRAIDVFKIDLSQFHNDSTTVTVYGAYRSAFTFKGKQTVKLKRGHNKDHRPDLKQLVYCLTVSRDHAVPIHYKVYDGNITDDRTHIETWEKVRALVKRSDFIYVADCKLCTRAQMEHIDRAGGRFITVLPKTRSEQAWFEQWAAQNKVPWKELLRTPDHRHPDSDQELVYYGTESPVPSKEGYRILWILSSQKQEQDQQYRYEQIQKTVDDLSELQKKVGHRNLKSQQQISEAVKSILETHGSERWFEWHTTCEESTRYKQQGKGRPGKDTPYAQVVTQQWTFMAMPNEQQIQADARMDGIFPLITNISKNQLAMKDVLLKYKYQPFVEKRHQQLKSVFDAMPVYLKAPHRVEAMMFVYFIVLLLNALIERQLRQAMQAQNIASLPLYPEERRCRRPTTERIVTFFSQQRRHILKSQTDIVKTFHDPLSDLQLKVLKLMGVAPTPYRSG